LNCGQAHKRPQKEKAKQKGKKGGGQSVGSAGWMPTFLVKSGKGGWVLGKGGKRGALTLGGQGQHSHRKKKPTQLRKRRRGILHFRE